MTETRGHVCAIIPARGGSKGIRRKNLVRVGGTPLVARAVATARATRGLDRVLVSTDDPEIADVARKAGAEVPFMRPPHLAADETPTVPVVQHAVEWLEAHGTLVDTVVLLQATSPFTRAAHVTAALRKFRETGADSVTTVCAAAEHPHWLQQLTDDRLLPFVAGGMTYGRRQDLPALYRLTGGVYVTRRDVVMKTGRMLGDDTRAIVLDRREALDIDDELDLKLAELIAAEEGP